MLSEEDPAFKRQDGSPNDLLPQFKKQQDPEKKIELLLTEQDRAIQDQLRKYSSEQAKGAWLNELCEEYYKKYSRNEEEAKTWPSDRHKNDDQELREILSTPVKNGGQIRQLARDKFHIELTGPPREWGWDAEKVFPDAPKDTSVMFVIDVSFSMDETDPMQDTFLNTTEKAAHDKLSRRLASVGAELGALTLSLLWDGTDDLDLHVLTTGGHEISFTNKNSPCGGVLDVDANGGQSKRSDPVENCYWVNAPPGTYTFWVHNYNNKNTAFWVREKHKGKVIMHQGSTSGSGYLSQRFTVNYPDPLEVAAQTRLQTAIDCICTILNEQLNDKDEIGLMTFATGVTTVFEPMKKEGKLDEMLDKVRSIRTSGRTKCYGAIREAATKLARYPEDTSKWVVALTDGKDTESQSGDVDAAADLFRKTPGLNFALISLGDDVDKGKINKMVSAAKAGKNSGMLESASSMDAVKRAFDKIAESMTMPSGGAAG